MEVILFKLHAHQDDETVDEINSDLFDATEDEPVVDLDGYRVCVDTHTTGFEVKACEWDATLSSCKEGEEVLTLNTKGGKKFLIKALTTTSKWILYSFYKN